MNDNGGIKFPCVCVCMCARIVCCVLADVRGEMEEERSAHREEVASLQLQLNTTSDQLK